MTYILLATLASVQLSQAIYFYRKLKALEKAPPVNSPARAPAPVDALPSGGRSAFSILYGNP